MARRWPIQCPTQIPRSRLAIKGRVKAWHAWAWRQASCKMRPKNEEKMNEIDVVPGPKALYNMNLVTRLNKMLKITPKAGLMPLKFRHKIRYRVGMNSK